MSEHWLPKLNQLRTIFLKEGIWPTGYEFLQNIDWEQDENNFNIRVSNKQAKVWWIEECGHCSLSTVYAKKAGQGCAVCRGLQIQKGFNDFATTHPEIAAEWHPVLNLDKGFTPEEITAGSNRLFWWLGKCGHEWEMKVYQRTFKNSPQGCPVCAGKKVSLDKNLAAEYPEISKLWHPTLNGSLKPNKVLPKSSKKVWWLGECGHEWEARISSLTHTKTLCPYCSGNLIQKGLNDFATLEPLLAKEWHPTKNTKHPTEITRASRYKAWWLCEKEHEWQVEVYSRTYGNGCRKCSSAGSSKVEENFMETLCARYSSLERKTNHWFTDSLNNKKYELDIVFPDSNFAVEFNGMYYHNSTHKPDDYHKDKWLAAYNEGYRIFYVWEDDWYDNPHNILNSIDSILYQKTEYVAGEYLLGGEASCSDFLILTEPASPPCKTVRRGNDCYDGGTGLFSVRNSLL